MNLWDKHKKHDKTNRQINPQLHFDTEIEKEFKHFAIAFCKWLRQNYEFPVVLNIYFVNTYKIRLLNGLMAYGSFRWYPKRSPRICIPAKIEPELLSELSKEDIYEMILSSMVHEITHYYQWTDNLKQNNAVSEKQANYYRYRIIDNFFDQTKYDFNGKTL